MKFVAEIYEPMYDHNDKKYIRVILPERVSQSISRVHKESVSDNPLCGRILTIKVPFRYRRVMAKNMGARPLQSLIKGDTLELDIEYMGMWSAGEHTGYSWKLTSFR
jgi:hypothetical protein